MGQAHSRRWRVKIRLASLPKRSWPPRGLGRRHRIRLTAKPLGRPPRSGASCRPTPIAPRDLKGPSGVWNAATSALPPEGPAERLRREGGKREGERSGRTRGSEDWRGGGGAQEGGPSLLSPVRALEERGKEVVCLRPGNL